MTHIPDNIIEQAANVILTTRDFCGNEREAVRDFAIESGYRAEWQKLHQIANYRANAEWNACQKAAGVPDKYTW